jgi:hypothetical protein
MKRLDLKNIIKEEIRNVLENEDPINIGMKKAIGFEPRTGPSKNKIVPAKEQEYEVSYWYRHGKDGDEKDYDSIKVMATTEEEAIKKAKENRRVPRGRIDSSFKAREIK